MKKWLAFLLLSITMAATFSPCFIGDKCNDEGLATTTNNHDNHKSQGTCSPFISCGTCPGFTQMTDIADIPLIQEEVLVHHAEIFSVSLSTYAALLLQPPRT